MEEPKALLRGGIDRNASWAQRPNPGKVGSGVGGSGLGDWKGPGGEQGGNGEK